MHLSKLIPCLMVLTCGNCASRSYDQRPARLKLTVSQRVNELPATLRFNVFIEGGRDDDPRLYCPDIRWDFGGAVFLDGRDCPAYESGVRIQRAYQSEHTFEREAAYDVEVALLHRGRPVLRADVKIQVRRTGVHVLRR